MSTLYVSPPTTLHAVVSPRTCLGLSVSRDRTP